MSGNDVPPTGDLSQDASSSLTAASGPTVSASTRASEGPMGSLIDQLTGGAPLGETEVGKAWCLKALHPADSNVLSSSMPTNETRSIASVGFNQMDVMTIPATFSTTKPWNLEIYVHRDPVLLYSVRMTQTGASDVVGFVFSRQIGTPAVYADAYNSLRTNCEKFRITSHAMTGYFDGASLSDQGHVVVAQTELPRITAPVWPVNAPTNGGLVMPVTFYQDPIPTYDLILQTTRAYQANAVAGFYAPSKLLNLGRWVYTNQAWRLAGSSVGVDSANPLNFDHYASTQQYADMDPAAMFNTFPWVRPTSGDPDLSVFAQSDTSLTTVFYTGISATSSIRLTMRWTMDMIVRPGTLYAPFTKMPPPEDSGALRMYAEISRRMADSYPSSHNNLAMLLPVIGKIAATLAPTVLGRLGTWFQGKVAANRAKPEGSNVWQLLDPLSRAQVARGAALATQMVRTPEEEKELATIKAQQEAMTPGEGASTAVSHLVAALSRGGQSLTSRGYTRRSYSGGGGGYKRRSYTRRSYSGGGGAYRRRSYGGGGYRRRQYRRY